MTTRRTVRTASTLFALALLASGAGCDWLDPSGSSSRLSPEISALQIVPRSVFCGPGAPVRISFDYSDPQDDVQTLLLDFQHARLDEQFSRSASWTDPNLNVVTAGRATYTFFFDCGGPSAGDWTVTVRVEDEKGHLSNDLRGDVTLVSTR